uniref:Nudix hydrolase 9 isoform X2 n=1 Tax=Elaeis guineensis var. tenera TaxID=51953 RepID=A0A6I9S657_ELAGV|nr:nudix hydrolase 9 isoform X2 [Elaeis guineensis]
MTSTLAGTGESGGPVDPGNAFKLLLSCPSGLPPSRVSVDFHPSYDRIPHPDANLEDSINEIWNRRLEENPSLYNGKKFRVVCWTCSASCGWLGPRVICMPSLRTFVGTNLNPLWEKFLIPSEDDSVRCQHTSSPLGNGAIVETSDNRILVLQRSYNVGEFPGYFVFPGGHSEPEELGISDHQNDKGLTQAADLNRKVSQEMFDGIIREVVEEIGVPAESLTDPVFIGISCREMNVRPTAFFFLKCNMESKEIYQVYSRAQDGFESTQLYTVSRDELRKMALRMPGCHHGGYTLYELMIQTVEDARQSSRWL